MSELAEKRQVFRSEISLPVLCRRKAPGPIKAGVGWTHNLSGEGACLELSDRLEESSAIQLLFQTDHGGFAYMGRQVEFHLFSLSRLPPSDIRNGQCRYPRTRREGEVTRFVWREPRMSKTPILV